MFRWIENNPVKTILITGMMIFINLNVIPVGIMEARNFITAREMITSGHWLLTTMNDIARYEKPPLPTWLTALSGMLFGIENVYFLRMPAALMAIALSLVMYAFSLLLTADKKQSLVNALILITSFYIINIIFEAPVDIFAHGFMLAGIYFLFLFFRENNHLWKNALAAGLFIGFSILSKGPISLYGLFLPFIIAYGIVFRFSDLNTKFVPLIGFIITSLLIGGSWFVYVRLADPKTLTVILTKETSNWGAYQVKPFYYYWTFFVQTGVWTILAFVSFLFPYLKNKVRHRREYYFSLLWTALSVVLLSFIPEKKPRYLVPVLIPLAINTGFYMQYLMQNFRHMNHWLEKLPVYFSFGLLSLLGVTVPVVGYFTFGNQLNEVWFNFYLTASAMFILAVLIFVALRYKEIEKVFVLTISFIVVVMLTGLPILGHINVNPEFNNINKLSANDNKINVYGFVELAPEIIWHYGKPIPVIDSAEQDLPNHKIYSVLVNPAYEDDFKRVMCKVGTIKLIETFNLNYFAGAGKKSRSNRLVCSHYLVKIDRE
jgi:4-amino-4-deoxy-L-arabinose transferase-like glycosyltransferase